MMIVVKLYNFYWSLATLKKKNPNLKPKSGLFSSFYIGTYYALK